MSAAKLIRYSWSMSSIAGPSRLPFHSEVLSASASLTPTSRSNRRWFASTPIHGSGHNRWSKIKHKKGAADAQRSALFSRLTSDINLALRPPNSPDPSINQRLALAVTKAREGGMTKAAIEGLFDRAKSAADGTGQSLTYEAMGPGGKEAFIIECLTDNTSRTFSRIKEILGKNKCRVAPVSFMFEKKGLVVVGPASTDSGASFDGLFELAVDGGAEDVKEFEGEDGVEWEIYTPPTELSNLTTRLSSLDQISPYVIRSSELAYIPVDPLVGDDVDEEKAESIVRVVDLLEGEADVIKVWTNLADD